MLHLFRENGEGNGGSFVAQTIPRLFCEPRKRLIADTRPEDIENLYIIKNKYKNIHLHKAASSEILETDFCKT